jgi:sec-independent protein translocase protein TatA
MLTDVFQPTHIILVLAVAFLVLGPKRLPGAGRAIGQGLREFKGSLTETHDREATPTLPSEDETATQ